MSNQPLNNLCGSRMLRKIYGRRSGCFDLEISSRLSTISESLELIYKNVAPSFVLLGGELQAICSDANELTERTLKSTRLVTGDSEKSVLDNVGTLTTYSLTELQSCRATVSDRLGNTNVIAGHLTGLNNMCAEIAKIAGVLRAVATYIGVESSRSTEASLMFTDFVQEIKELVKKMDLIYQSIVDDSRMASISQSLAYKEISVGLSQLSELIDAAEENVREAVIKTEQIMKLSLEALEKVGSHSQNISRQVGEIVVAIQFHDITRQKVEHMVESLYDIGKIFSGNTSGKTRTGRLNDAHSILRIQSEQLKHIITEINAAYEQSVNAFGKIDDRVNQLVNSAAGLSHNSDDEGQGEDSFSKLNSALLDLYQLLSRGRCLEDNLKNAARQVSDTSAQVSCHLEGVRQINHEMHIKSLNAIIKTAHLGKEGETLDVLAQEVNRLSIQSNKFVGKVSGLLDSITVSARKLGETEEIPVENSDRGISVEDGIHEISSTYERFIKETSDALQQAESLQMNISKTSSGLVFLTELACQLTENLTQLEKVVEEISSWTSRDNSWDKKAASEIDQIKTRYTMEKERMIHEEVVGLPLSNIRQNESETIYEFSGIGGKNHGEDYSVEPEKADGEDALGDNVELF